MFRTLFDPDRYRAIPLNLDRRLSLNPFLDQPLKTPGLTMDPASILFTIAGDFDTTAAVLSHHAEDLRGMLNMLEDCDYPGAQALARDLIERLRERIEVLRAAAGRARRAAEQLPKEVVRGDQ